MDFNLTEDEQIIQSTIRDLAQTRFKDRARDIDLNSIYPSKNIKELAELGFMGSIIDEEYGGAGGSTITYSLVLEEIAKACASTSVIVSVATMVALAIQREGTNAQKENFIPRITSGQTLGAFCLTEPQAGSDPSRMKTKAELVGDDYILSGQKLWITNAAHSDIFLIMAREISDSNENSISAFIVDKTKIEPNTLQIGEPEKKIGLNGSHTCALFLDNLTIPKENKLGQSGKGLSIALKSLDTGRIGIASQAIGIGSAAFEDSLNFAQEREQFGRRIGKFQGISFKFADMKMKLEASRLLTYKAAWLRDQGLNHTLESSIAKAYSTETANEITSNAVRIHGGMGISKELPIERYHRDVQATLIYEGTNEIQRLVIARELKL
ncbi:MAG: acyl-CoA dehydrogenase family protein [Candidatus Heimdallarchaeota archaeon]|nr:acyl-CoA dehydrogenase family protein [Candidatus Heimdallarchaeota archaeon]MDH5645063.1 acyl-CoA dehydrogenase family protein [Candidatus Heimdallarchaeota archaeon]